MDNAFIMMFRGHENGASWFWVWQSMNYSLGFGWGCTFLIRLVSRFDRGGGAPAGGLFFRIFAAWPSMR